MAALFYLKWDDLQVNVPNPLVPAQFFIANAAGATSKGADLELNVRLMPGCDFFGGLGYTNARFEDGSVSSGVDVSGNRLANTPNYTANFGGQYSLAVTTAASLFARAEVVVRGSYEYRRREYPGAGRLLDRELPQRRARQALVRGGWIRNAFDTRYVPIAFAYPGLAPSGFVGEIGAPRTFGIRAGVTF